MNEIGQTTVEFSIMLVMTLLISFVMVILLSTIYQHGWRILLLVGLDYP